MAALFRDGGWVLVAILTVSLVAWGLMIHQWLELRSRSLRARLVAEFRAVRLGPGDPVPRSALLERSLRRRIHRPLNGIGTVGTVAPLLGLLGTVLGMIHTFQALSDSGRTDVAGLTAGISEALVTTQVGLVVAVPIVVLHRSLARRWDRLLDESRAASETAMGSETSPRRSFGV